MEKNKFFYELFREKWLLIISFMTIYLPIVLMNIYLYSYSVKYNVDNYAYTDYTGLLMFTLYTACLIAVLLFRFLNKKEQIDFTHSLPLTREALFFSKYMKGIIYFSLPYFATILTTCLLDNFHFPEVQILTFSFLFFVVKYWLLICLGYTMFVIATLLCGMSIYAIFCGIFLLTAPLLWLQQMDSVASTLTGELPKYSISNQINNLFFYDILYSGNFSINIIYILVVILLIVINALLYVLSIKLYKSRKSEMTSTPIAIRKAILPLKVVSVYFVTFFFIVTTLNYSGTDNLFNYFIVVLFILGITLVCEVLISQGIRKFKLKNFIITSAMSLGVLGLTFGSVNLGLYQATYMEVPSDDILSIEIRGLSGTGLEIEELNSTNYVATSGKYIMTGSEDIERTMDLIYRLCEVDARKEYYAGLTDDDYYSEKIQNHLDNFEDVTFTIITENQWLSYNLFLDKSDEYSMVLYNELVMLPSDESYYVTALNLLEDTSRATFEDYRVSNGVYYDYVNENQHPSYYLKKTQYPLFPQEVDEEFLNTIKSTFKELAKLDVSEFDKIPLTKLRLQSNYMYNQDYYPITTDAGDLLKYAVIPDQQYIVYDILGSENAEEIIEEVLEPRNELSYYYQTLVNRGRASYALESVNSATQLLTFNTDDLLSERILPKIYTKELTREAIEQYDLKLIHSMDSGDWYFGTLEVQND